METYELCFTILVNASLKAKECLEKALAFQDLSEYQVGTTEYQEEAPAIKNW